MKRILRYILLSVIGVCFFACSDDASDNGQTIASINNFDLTMKEFNEKLTAELEYDRDFKLTKEGKDKFLDDIIRKEVLIQEAWKRGLDKNEEFMKTIERYWESTLIRDLMELKGEEISKNVFVSQEEIKAYYDNLKASGEDVRSFEDMEVDIRHYLKEQKKTRKLKEWIDELRGRAEIKINNKLLYKD